MGKVLIKKGAVHQRTQHLHTELNLSEEPFEPFTQIFNGQGETRTRMTEAATF